MKQRTTGHPADTPRFWRRRRCPACTAVRPAGERVLVTGIAGLLSYQMGDGSLVVSVHRPARLIISADRVRVIRAAEVSR